MMIQIIKPVYGPGWLLLLMACGGGTNPLSSETGHLIITNSDYRATESNGETNILPNDNLNGSTGDLPSGNPQPNVPVPPTKEPITPNMPPTGLALDPDNDKINEGDHNIGKELSTILITDDDGGKNEITLSNDKFFVVTDDNGVNTLWLKSGLSFDFDEANKHVVKVTVVTNPNLKQFFTLNIINVIERPDPIIDAPLDFTIHERVGGYTPDNVIYSVRSILDSSATNIRFSISDTKNIINDEGIPYFTINNQGNVHPNEAINPDDAHNRQFFVHDTRQFYIFDVTVIFELGDQEIEITETITIYISRVENMKTDGEMNSIAFNRDGNYKFTPDQTKIDEYHKSIMDEYKGDLDEKITKSYLEGLIEKYQSDIIVVGTEYDDIINGGSGKDTIYAQDGNDFVSAKNGNDAIYGSYGDDTLKGGAGNDILAGEAGEDVLNGGSGIDTAIYRLGVDNVDPIGVNVNLTTGVGSGNVAEGDTLINIENIIGSKNPDTLTGDNKNNIITGMASGDVIDGMGGFDTASYIGSDAQVIIDLANRSATGGHATGDMLSNIENLFGSSYDDILIGDDRVNIFDGKSGSDRLTGGSGGDKFILVSSYSGVDTITDFSFEDGDKIRVFDDIIDPKTLEDIGIAIEESTINQDDAVIVSNRGDYQIYMILEDVDYTNITFDYFEVI